MRVTWLIPAALLTLSGCIPPSYKPSPLPPTKAEKIVDAVKSDSQSMLFAG